MEDKKILDNISKLRDKASNPFDALFYAFLLTETEKHMKEKTDWEITTGTYFPWDIKKNFYDEEWLKSFIEFTYCNNYDKAVDDILQNPKMGLRGRPRSLTDIAFTDRDYWTCVRKCLGDISLVQGYTKALQADYEYRTYLWSKEEK